jgi:hypothetical protein
MMEYHVAIPYWFHFYVEAESEAEAINKAHETEGRMGEYDDELTFVELVTAIPTQEGE